MPAKKEIFIDYESADFLASLALEALHRIDESDFSAIFGLSKLDGEKKFKSISEKLFSDNSEDLNAG